MIDEKRWQKRSKFLAKLKHLVTIEKYNVKKLKDPKFLIEFNKFMSQTSQKIETELTLVRFMMLTDVWTKGPSRAYPIPMTEELQIWNWVETHCQGKAIEHGGTYWFQYDDDAIKFKIRW
jgi:hypothetical protein